MRRTAVVAFLFALVLVTGLTHGLPSAVRAQESSPAAGQDEGTPVPVRTRALASGAVQVLTPGTANFVLGRLVLAPGASLPLDPNDPSASLIYVQSGTLSARVSAPMRVARNAERGTPTAGQPEAVAADTEFTLGEGDAALFPPAATGEIRNDGVDEATAWVVSLVVLKETGATPTP
jgi:hypothetical protein